jgi:hypothetical protein
MAANMSYAISVPTPFNDISELAESFASRVDEERLMLPNADHVPEGEWVQFAVVLADGTAAIAGTGRCTNCVDNGEDRAPEHRFDVVMDSLQLDEMAQIYFERILQVRAAQMGEEPETGEVALGHEDEAEAYGGTQEAAGYDAPADYDAAEEFGSEATHAVSFDELAEAAGVDPAAVEALPYEAPAQEGYADAAYADAGGHAEAGGYAEAELADLASAELDSAELAAAEVGDDWDQGSEAAPAEARPQPRITAPAESAIYDLPPPSEPGKLPSPHSNGAVLTRRVLTTGWSPEPALRPDPGPSSGLFEYAHGAGLPRPEQPPRPEMDPGWRVHPAPRPGDAYEPPAAMSAAPYAEEAGEHAEQGEYAYDDSETAEGEALASEGEAEVYEPEADYAGEDDLDFGDLPDHAQQPGEETMQVEMPDDETA